MLDDSESCISTVDSKGVPYCVRLREARESARKSSEAIAALLKISAREYYDLEAVPEELTMGISLSDLSTLSSALGVRTESIFEDRLQELPQVSPEQLCAKIKAHLATAGMSIEEFESRVGFVIEPCLRNPSEVMKWNVDCLRFVCNEIGVDWRSALP